MMRVYPPTQRVFAGMAMSVFDHCLCLSYAAHSAQDLHCVSSYHEGGADTAQLPSPTREVEVARRHIPYTLRSTRETRCLRNLAPRRWESRHGGRLRPPRP